MTVNVLLEDAFDGHQGNDLYDVDKAHYRSFRVKKQATVGQLLDTLAESFKYPVSHIRPWPFNSRNNQVCIDILSRKYSRYYKLKLIINS